MRPLGYLAAPPQACSFPLPSIGYCVIHLVTASAGVAMLDDMVAIFETANKAFLDHESANILLGVSERSLCGSLMLYLRRVLDETRYAAYHVDIEYNRNKDGKLKTIINGSPQPITICCDLIVHSRGAIVGQDNLIALEMKRNTHPKEEKDKDKLRLKCLTKDSFDDVWSFDGKHLPEHVCRYVLGVYYELNVDKRQIIIKYYVKGKLSKELSIPF
jgi:hypothetical protein